MWTFVLCTAAVAVECIKRFEQVGLTIPRFPAPFHENGSIDFEFSLRPLQHYSLLLKAIAGSPQGPRGSPVLPIPTWQTAVLHYSLLTNTYIAAKYQILIVWDISPQSLSNVQPNLPAILTSPKSPQSLSNQDPHQSLHPPISTLQTRSHPPRRVNTFSSSPAISSNPLAAREKVFSENTLSENTLMDDGENAFGKYAF